MTNGSSAQDVDNLCVGSSVPANTSTGLLIAVGLVVIGGWFIQRRLREPSHGPAVLLAILMLISITPKPAAAEEMCAIRPCVVTLTLESFGIQDDTEDVGDDDGWEIHTTSAAVGQTPSAKTVVAAPASEPSTQGFSPAPVIGTPTRKNFPAKDGAATQFSLDQELQVLVRETDLTTGNFPFETHEESPFVPNTKEVFCPKTGSWSAQTSVAVHGLGGDKHGFPVPVPPGGEEVPLARNTDFDVTVTYRWTAAAA